MDIRCPHCESAVSFEAEHLGMQVICRSYVGVFITLAADPTVAAAPVPLVGGASVVARAAPVFIGLKVAATPGVKVGRQIREKGITRLVYFTLMLTGGIIVGFAGVLIGVDWEKFFATSGGMAAVVIVLAGLLGFYVYASVSRARNIGWSGWVGAILALIPFGAIVLLAMPPGYKFDRELDLWFWIVIIYVVISAGLSIFTLLAMP